jgi:hypothetical protein
MMKIGFVSYLTMGIPVTGKLILLIIHLIGHSFYGPLLENASFVDHPLFSTFFKSLIIVPCHFLLNKYLQTLSIKSP